MSEPARLRRSGQRVAVFTKPRGSDYVWTERAAIPDALAELAPWIAEFDTPINVVLTGPEAHWFLRCTSTSVGSDGRLIMCSEVYRLKEESPLRPADALAIAADSTLVEESPGRWRFDIQVVSDSRAASSVERAATRLALPLSVPLEVARDLVTLPVWRFQGICFARGGGIVWSEELRGFLAVNIQQPRLSKEEQQLLDAGTALKDERRWAILDRLPTEQARLVIRGGVEAMRAPELRAELIEWTVLNDPGPAALAGALEQLRMSPKSLAPMDSLIQRELGASATAALKRIIQGETESFDAGALEALCEHGLLRWLGDDYIHAWAAHAAESPCAEAFLIDALAGGDFDPRLVRWLVRGTNAGGEWSPSRIAALFERLIRLSVPPHPDAVATWITTIDADDRPLLQSIENSVSGTPAALARVVLRGETSDWTELSESQLAAALIARYGLFGEDATLEYIVRLREGLGAGTTAAILDSCLSSVSETSSVRILVRAVIASLRGDTLDIAVPGDLLRRLAVRGLLSAASMPVQSREDLLRGAQLFGGLSSLASLLAQPPRWTGSPDIPAQWLRICREMLPAAVFERVAASVDRSDRDAFAGFVAYLHGLDPSALSLLRGTGRETTAAAIEALRGWMPVLNPLFDLDDRLQSIVSILRTGEPLAESIAIEVVTLLFSSASRESRDLLLHLLTGLGPFPPLGGVTGDLLARLVPFVEIGKVIDGLFMGSDAAAADDVIRAVVEQVNATGAAYPAHGYTAAQKNRSERLVLALSQCRGWEALITGRDERRRRALHVLESLGIEPLELMDELPPEGIEERDDTA